MSIKLEEIKMSDEILLALYNLGYILYYSNLVVIDLGERTVYF
jgi:hypothetical protein